MINKKAYAKINLVLNVLGKREDNFHEVDFIMATLDLHDNLSFELHDQDLVICPDSVCPMEDNLAYIALKKMKAKYKITNCYKITIEKNIPVAAGMAGGSSDAACVINTLNELEGLSLSLNELMALGALIGSDIPFCIYSQVARATGRGEVIQKLDLKLPNYHVVVVNPGVSLSTPKVYQALTTYSDNDKVNNFIENYQNVELNQLIFNQMQATACSLVPEIDNIINEFKTNFDQVGHVSGSGPTVFTIVEDSDVASRMYEYFKTKYPATYLTTLRG